MLKIHDLTFTYPGQKIPALSSVNADITPGKLVLVTGPSGSGKSTLLHCINGLATQHYGGSAEGEISVAGREIAGKSLWQISELVGTVFQNPNTQFFQLTVEDEIVFGLEHAGLDRATIERQLIRALQDVEIEHLRHRDLFTLSSGEKQKVALASILAMDQPLILLDEPTANLDIAAIHELKEIFKKIKKQGRTILVSEHRLWYLRELADQLIVIKDGQIAYDGQPNILKSTEFRDAIGLRIWEQSPQTKMTISCLKKHQETILKVSGLTGGPSRKKHIVNNIDLTLETGCCVALMGHNGAGKTMLSRLLTGLQKEQQGSITINGQALKTRQRIGKLACVTQQADQQLFSDTVLDELLIHPDDAPATRQQAEQMLKQYDLSQLAGRHPQTLSGGEKQRLAIAAAMIANPGIIILDEPTSGMDRRRMELLAEQIVTLCRQKVLVILITHDVELVASCADQILWMENGTVTETINRNGFEVLLNDLMKMNSTNERHEHEISNCLLK